MHVSAMIMHWARPANLQKIVHDWMLNPLINEYIVFSNTGEMPSLPAAVVQITANKDLGMRSRYLAALVARNRCVLIQDDDLLLPTTTINSLVKHWQYKPESIHGIFGRNPKEDGGYAHRIDRKEAKVDVVLTRALVTDRVNASRFFEHENSFPLLDRGQPVGNGEDIVLSYVAKAYSGQQNEVHALIFKELPAPKSIHQRIPGHWDHRTKVMIEANKWCQQQLLALTKPLQG